MSAPTAIVTGAANGIGKAIALRLSKDGYDVTLNDLPSNLSALQEVETTIKADGRRALIITGDVSQEETVKTLVESTVEEHGGLDVMVANAGVGSQGSFLELPVSELERTFAINVKSIFLCYQYAARQMVKQGRGGRIIGASSAAGKQGAPMMSAYSASKFAVRGLTQAVSTELGQYGITVNAYAPGLIDTPLLYSTVAGMLPPDAAEEYLTTNAHHIGKPEDIAGFVAYLAKKESGFITGQTVSINGGFPHFD